MENFDEMIRACSELRRRKESSEMQAKMTNGDYIYTRFCVWCNAYKNGQGKHDAKLFAQYIKENEIALNWWQRKRIAENYFNYEIKYDYKSGSWIERRKKND